MVKKYVCIARSFLVVNVCNQGKTLCSPCRSRGQWTYHKIDFEMKEVTTFESVRVCRFWCQRCSWLLCRRKGKLVLLFVRI